MDNYLATDDNIGFLYVSPLKVHKALPNKNDVLDWLLALVHIVL